MADLLPSVARELRQITKQKLNTFALLDAKESPGSPKPNLSCQIIPAQRMKHLAYRPSLSKPAERKHLKACFGCRNRLDMAHQVIEHPNELQLELYRRGTMREPDYDREFMIDHIEHKGCDFCRTKLQLPPLPYTRPFE